MDPSTVAERLGLGASRGRETVLKADEGNWAWRVATDSGVWVVKVRDNWGDDHSGVIERAGQLEIAAWRAGIAVPEPFLSDAATVGVWQPVDEHHHASAQRFLPGEHPETPLPPSIASWTGATIAALERLAIPTGPAADYAFIPHPESDWDEWLAQAVDLGVLDRKAARDLKAAAMHVNRIITSAVARPPEKIMVHNDISLLNILVTAEGPVLLDFDGAAPGVPWWDLISTAFGMDGDDVRTVEPVRSTVDNMLSGYLDAGGTIGPTDETAFTGMLAGRLASTAWELWMACGHRGGGPELRAEFTRAVRISIGALSTMVDSTGEWTTWLRG
ncbi:aminoglycoside phosphotransferase family protein [Microbacterium sp. LWH7-1.2]|uniref:aminoglycoside phosphotransferase family protein n=1 Tax=Microbacterium sp. LWH7-1.2 TaxID=3135257 RepID=UPI003138B236